MPTVDRDGHVLQYTIQGTGPTVVLVPDACVGPWMWAWVTDALAGPFRVLTYTPRGYGASSAAFDDANATAASEGVTVPDLVADLDAVVTAVDPARVHVVGCGLGGQVALQYAATDGRTRTMTLLGTGPAPTFDREITATLCDPDPITSLRPYLGPVLDRLDTDQLRRWRTTDDPPPATRKCSLEAAAAFATPPLYDLTRPARVLHGEADTVWNIDGARALGEALPRATVDTVVDAPHLLPVATPTLVADEIAGLIDRSTDDT